MDPSPISSNPPSPETVSGTERRDENDHRKLEDFRKALLEQTSRPVVTFLVVLANVAVFVWMVQQGVSPVSPTPLEIINWGANYGPLTLNGEEWRLFACMFLHIGLIHLGMNMMALWNLGRILERLVGPTGFLLLYLISGLAGSLASVYWSPMNPSAGASGAIFGVAGAWLGLSWKLRRTLPKAFLKSARFLMWNVIVLFVGFNLLNYFYQPMIDNSAHLAGLLSGVVCGLILAEPLPNPGRSFRLLRNLILAIGGTAGLYLAFSMFPGPPADVVKLEQKYLRVSRTVDNKLKQADGRYRAGAMSPEEYAAFLEKEVVPRWQEVYTDFASAENVPANFEPLVGDYMKVTKLFQTSFELEIEAIRENNPGKKIRSTQTFNEANAILKRMQEEAEAKQPPNDVG